MRTRFCPSPTGNLHVGNMRTALFNFLFALKQKGSFLLRIEDTDAARSLTKFNDSIVKDLASLDIFWDSGYGHIEDDNPLYMQSKRLDIYREFHNKLLRDGQAYYCFCSDAELELERKLQLKQGQPPRYSGKCKRLDELTVSAKLAASAPASIRFAVPSDQTIKFNDLLRGSFSFSSNDLSDFIICKTDGMPSFMFANAVDDGLMSVTHVMRGEDHLTNTPRQILLLQALGMHLPHYIHLSIILGKDKQPLSKRNGSVSIAKLLEQGYLPVAIVNYLARLGHRYESNEILNLMQLALFFSTDHLVKSPAVFDLDQLKHWQQLAIQELTREEFWQQICADYHHLVPQAQQANFIDVVHTAVLFEHDLHHWYNVVYADNLAYSSASFQILQQAGVDFFERLILSLQDHDLDLAEAHSAIANKLGIKGKKFYQPVRVALSDRVAGPELPVLIVAMGRQQVLNRLTNVISKLK